MADYIDREAVCKRLVEAADVQRKAKSREFAAGMMGAQGVVWMFPTAENVVEVVRCRECLYNTDDAYHECIEFGIRIPDDAEFFCKYGKRRRGR